MEEFEQQKLGLFQLIDTFRPSDIKLAFLLMKNNPELRAAAQEYYGPWLAAKGYQRLEGIISLALMKDLPFWEERSQPNDPKAAHYKDRLTWLAIDDNNLDVFPDTILQKIENLKIHSYSISSLPERIGVLENLQELILTNCKKLESLPLVILQLKYLKKITFWGTLLEYNTGISYLNGQEEIQAFLKKNITNNDK